MTNKLKTTYEEILKGCERESILNEGTIVQIDDFVCGKTKYGLCSTCKAKAQVFTERCRDEYAFLEFIKRLSGYKNGSPIFKEEIDLRITDLKEVLALEEEK